MQRIIKPYISFDEVETDFREILESGILTKGPYVGRFRERIREYIGASNAFLTTSATTALWLSLKAAGIKAGDEVIVSDFSFPASANVIEDLGAIPVFADVDLHTFNMLPEELEKKLTRKTKAVMFVDALGNPSGILEIKNICKKYNLILIEDAACAFGSSVNNIKCGNIADMTCFSFHPRKLLTTGEGGAITTNLPGYTRFFEVKLNHGAVVDSQKQDFVDYGYNFRLPEIQAAMGIKQVEKIDSIIESRQKIKAEYVKQLNSLGFAVQTCDDNVVHNVQSVVFKVPEGLDRDGLIAHLRNNQIESTLGTYCLSNTTYYRNKYGQIQPNAAFLEKNTITLPCFEGVDVNHICESISKFVKPAN